MPRLGTILRWSALLACAAPLASAARITPFNRIGMNDPFGGSRFARSLHELSEQGRLDPSPPQLVIDQDYLNTYASPYILCRTLSRYGYSYGYYDLDPFRTRYPYGIDARVRDGVQPASRMTMPPGTAVPAPPAASASSGQTTPPPTDLGSARRSFAAGDFGDAVNKYRAHVNKNPDDFAVAAELATALIADGRLDDGIAMMRLAYGSDPGLAFQPISDRVMIGQRTWRKLVVRTVRHAHRGSSASAWLTVAVLMQAEGRPGVARRMIERAERAGLDQSIVSSLVAVLR